MIRLTWSIKKKTSELELYDSLVCHLTVKTYERKKIHFDKRVGLKPHTEKGKKRRTSNNKYVYLIIL